LLSLHDRLLDHFGPQHWWPGDGPWAVCAGAVLTQNTRWANAERALRALADAGYATPERIHDAPEAEIEGLIRPAGFFRQKRRALKALAAWVVAGDGFAGRGSLGDLEMRGSLLGLPGIGPETADCIILYAFARPAFVADAYARRILSRTGLWPASPGPGAYDQLKSWVESRLPGEVPLFNELHALLVALAKTHCRAQPRCESCPLNAGCAHALTGRRATCR
jgi:endonuclease-3 related protein